MVIGDLVTLSQYAQRLTSIPFQYRRHWGGSTPLYGIITEVKNVPNPWGRCSKNELTEYIVRWNIDNLEGRTWHSGYFYRNDLKFFK